MRIAILDFDDIKNPLLNAGQARATFEVGKRLVAKGHQVVVISSRFPGSKDRFEEGMFYTHIGLGSQYIRLNNLLYILSAPLFVRNLDVDIILECFTAPISTLFTPLFTNIPVVAKPTSFEATRFAKRYHLPFNLIEKTGARFYRYFIPYSQEQETRMLEMNKNVITKIISEGVSSEYLKVHPSKAEFILFLGRLDIDQKGIDLLIESYAQIKDRFLWPLLIAGHGPDEKKVRNLIIKYGLEKRVKLIGPVYGEEKKQLLAKSLLVALPSRHEGFGLFALEALASGLPIVSFDIPGFSWFDLSVSLKAKPFDVLSYSECLIKSVQPDVFSVLRPNCKMFAESFTWEKVADNLESFFVNILRRETFSSKQAPQKIKSRANLLTAKN